MKDSKKLRWLIAGIIFLASSVVYLLTAAPTVSFWDCGEFVACANILGIPHPPGTPFYMIIGRFFIMAFSAFGEVAYRMNLISVFGSSLAVTFGFLFTDKLLVLGLKLKDSNFASLMGGAIAAALIAFSDTFWFSAVEAEVYGITMFLLMFMSWLSLKWAEAKDTPHGERLLVLLGYLSFLGVGLHLTSMVTLPVMFLFVVMIDRKKLMNIPLWITGILLMSVIYAIGQFLVFAAIAVGLCLVGYFMSKESQWKANWNLSLWLAIVAVLGFSTHAYIPIRSDLNPRIDENNPETYAAYQEFLERKQYGSESMIKRAFYRRANVGNQLFSHPNMGYGGYMLAQYLPWKVGGGRSVLDEQKYKGKWHFQLDPEENEPLEIFGIKFPTQMTFMPPDTGRLRQVGFFLLFHIPMLWGVWLLYRRHKAIALYAFLLYFIGSFAMIFYINFSDGTRPELASYNYWVSQGKLDAQFPGTVHMEVRERDYFYTVGYIFMGVLFGISAAMLLEKLKARASAQSGSFLPKGVGAALLIVSIVVPGFSNYYIHDRSGMYVPFDYAKNLLESCLPNSVLFTNGDNDTFPLWFAQEVENIRKDVRVVNLSLGNTDWYIEQMLTLDPKLKLGFTKDQIKTLAPTGNSLQKDVEYTLGNTGLTVTLLSRDKQPYYRVQDVLVMNIVQNNYPERPIHFAATVSNSNMMGLEKYMKMDAMVYTLTNEVRNQEIDPVRTAYLVDSVYQYRNLGNSGIYMNSDTKGLLSNYFSTNHRLARYAQDAINRIQGEITVLQTANPGSQGDSMAVEGSLLRAKQDSIQILLAFGNRYIEKTEELLPWDWRHYYFAGQYYQGTKQTEKAISTLEKGMSLGIRVDEIAASLGGLYMSGNDFGKAESLFQVILKKDADNFQVIYALAEAYEKQKKFEPAKELLQNWLKNNASHQYAQYLQQKLGNIEMQMNQGSTPTMPGLPPTP